MAALLGCTSDEVTFTSGGTEAINWVLKGTMEAMKQAHPEMQGHIVTAITEHIAVLDTCR